MINLNINDDKQGISLKSLTQAPEISTVPFSRDKASQETPPHPFMKVNTFMSSPSSPRVDWLGIPAINYCWPKEDSTSPGHSGVKAVPLRMNAPLLFSILLHGCSPRCPSLKPQEMFVLWLAHLEILFYDHSHGRQGGFHSIQNTQWTSIVTSYSLSPSKSISRNQEYNLRQN